MRGINMAEKNSFFDGIEFKAFGHNSQATECMARRPLFYGVQYVYSGAFYLSVSNGKKYHLRGPAAFLTSPEVEFAYGSPQGTSRCHCHVCFCGERVQRYLSSGLFEIASQRREPFIRINNPQQLLNDMLELILILQNGTQNDFAVAERVLYRLRHIRPRQIGKHYFTAAAFLQLACQQLRRRFRVAVNGRVGNYDALAFHAVARPNVV